jgi:muramoyltetrapeptide carboxypeptidase
LPPSRVSGAPLAAAILALGACAGTGTGTSRPTLRAPEGMIWPAPLRPGDTIMFVAPAGPLDRERMARARQRLEARGYRVVERDDLFFEEGYLAGDDARRADELMQAFLDPDVDAIFPGTGGYGTMRILERLDYAAIRAHPKILVGFSDITALHAAINRRAGLVTFHGPSPMWTLGGADAPTTFTEHYFFRALEDPSGYEIEIPAESPQPFAWGTGRATGRLVGGNLSMISALEGTPYAIDTRDAILLIEDVGEAPYRVDRMLRQLQLAGKLQQLRGAIIGQFTRVYDREADEEREDPRYTAEGVIRQYFENLGIPVLVNFPVGHHSMNGTLPMGGLVEVDAAEARLAVLEN